jgi:hypothetical protein
MRAFGMSDISSLRTCRREEHVCGAAYMDSCCMGLAVTFGLFFFLKKHLVKHSQNLRSLSVTACIRGVGC